MIPRLEAVHPVIGVTDVLQSTLFYEGLGFTIVFRDDPVNPNYICLKRDQVEIHLQWQEKEQLAWPIDRPVYRFYVADVDGLYKEFQDRGSLATQPVGLSPLQVPVDTPWKTREFHLHDPDQNGLQFYYPLKKPD